MKQNFKRNFNIIIDILSYAGFVFLATTGLLMRYTLPAGSGHHTTVWGLDRHEWGTLHFWISMTFLFTLVLHLIFHWNWIICILRGRKTESSGFRFGLGLFALIILLILAITPFLSPVESVFYPGQQRRLQRNEALPEIVPQKNITIKSESSVSKQLSDSENPESDPFSETVQSTSENELHHEFSVDEIRMRGSETLKEVSDEFGVPVSHLLKELGLPEYTDENETFGRLKKEYDFEMHDVRKIISDYIKK